MESDRTRIWRITPAEKSDTQAKRIETERQMPDRASMRKQTHERKNCARGNKGTKAAMEVATPEAERATDFRRKRMGTDKATTKTR